MCERFVNGVSTCSLEQFAKYEGALYDLEPVERTLNGYIENLRKDELKDQEVVEALRGSIAVMAHLSEVHAREGLGAYADEVVMKALLMQSQLENTAVALHALKVDLISKLPYAEDDKDDEVLGLAKKTDMVVNHSRSARVIVGKTVRSLQELRARNLSLNPEVAPAFDDCQTATAELAEYARTLGQFVFAILHEEGLPAPPSLADIFSAIRRTTESHFQANDSEPLATFDARIRTLADRLNDLNTISTDLSETLEFETPPAPWVLRSRALKAHKLVSMDAEVEVTRLKQEVLDRATELRVREKELEEQDLEVETLKSRMKEAREKVGKIREMEERVEESKQVERRLKRAMEKHMKEMLDLEQDRDKWKQHASLAKPVDGVVQSLKGGNAMPAGSAMEMQRLQAELKLLESSNRYLREVARREQLEQQRKDTTWLSVPLGPPKSSQHSAEARAREEGKAVLEKLLRLPDVVKVVRLGERKPGWQPQKTTPQWQLSQAELQGLRAWDPWASGLLKGPLSLLSFDGRGLRIVS
ncbi:hypothetical protein LTS18_005133 [Coniosporium uncinatum]|uniref:Uncharacterized protein n=1 Tax=Coniosporium uncinatum TaxID=93489 RepID=A0ACC3DS32_9PEZI|nr:hypothetical protein LTS18_005133 [Coniosporium uncinatum]